MRVFETGLASLCIVYVSVCPLDTTMCIVCVCLRVCVCGGCKGDTETLNSIQSIFTFLFIIYASRFKGTQI